MDECVAVAQYLEAGPAGIEFDGEVDPFRAGCLEVGDLEDELVDYWFVVVDDGGTVGEAPEHNRFIAVGDTVVGNADVAGAGLVELDIEVFRRQCCTGRRLRRVPGGTAGGGMGRCGSGDSDNAGDDQGRDGNSYSDQCGHGEIPSRLVFVHHLS
ncbi:MAG: hypothetical protein OEW83_17780 [Acidimicrobiia bacterium]|nr:hypothetical protein [Acidimicrobiia bacterium]